MIRVLEVLATLKRAGAETMVASLVCRLDRTRFEPAVVTLFDSTPNDLEPQVKNCGVPVWRLGKKPGFDPRMFARLREIIREFRPDIVHTHSYVMRYLLPFPPCAMVHTVHNLASREVDTIGRLVHRTAFRRGAVSVAVAAEVARSFEEVYGFPPTVTIPNGIDAAAFRRPEARDRWRSANGFQPEDFLIVSVARLEEQKNPRMLVEAFRSAPPHCHLLLAGAGSMAEEFRNLERIHVLGVRKDLPELLAGADLFAMASDWEGHPIAVMEAMAAGLPVVATSTGGVPEIVGDAGILVPVRDTDAMGAALRDLAEDADQRAELSRRARERSQSFDAGAMVQSYSELFERAVVR